MAERETHVIMAANNYAYQVRSWTVNDDGGKSYLQARYDAACAIKDNIAVFWYINGTIHKFTLLVG